jgi:hypothetical protein
MVHARRLKSEVLCHDFAIPNMSTESEIALTRFRYRIDPLLRSRVASAPNLQAPPPAPTIWPLPPAHPWLRATDDLLRNMNLPGAGGPPLGPTFQAPTRHDITAAAQRKAALHAYTAHGNPPRLTGRRRTRASMASGAPASLDGFKSVFAGALRASSARLRPAWYLTQPPAVALPSAMLRSGHLFPLDGDQAPPPHPASTDYPFCGDDVSRDGQEPPLRELPWLRICHVLLQCESPAQLARVDALFGFCDSMDLLPGLPPAYATHVRLLTRCLRTVCCAGAPSPAWLFLLQDWLLQFLSAPTEWMHPRRFVWPQLARLATQLLRGDPPPDSHYGKVVQPEGGASTSQPAAPAPPPLKHATTCWGGSGTPMTCTVAHDAGSDDEADLRACMQSGGLRCVNLSDHRVVNSAVPAPDIVPTMESPRPMSDPG